MEQHLILIQELKRIGIFTATPIQKFQFNSEDDNTFVITDEGRVGIGKTNPEFGIVGLNTAAQGELKLDVDGSIFYYKKHL